MYALGIQKMSIPEKVLAGIDRLEPLPITVQRLLEMTTNESVKTSELVEVIEYDGAVAANILRAANSAAYGGRFHVEKIRDAVVRLGTNTLLDIILGEHFRSRRVAAPLYDLSEDDLWLHGAASSLAVRALTREASPFRIPPLSSIAALVHDIGKLIMVRYLEADVARILALCDEKHLTFVDAEREMFGFDHSEVGAMMGKKWGFPELIVTAIEMHHHCPAPRPNPVLDAVMLANYAAKTIGVGLGAAGMNMRVDFAGCSQRLGLSLTGFERACAQTACWVAEMRTASGK